MRPRIKSVTLVGTTARVTVNPITIDDKIANLKNELAMINRKEFKESLKRPFIMFFDECKFIKESEVHEYLNHGIKVFYK